MKRRETKLQLLGTEGKRNFEGVESEGKLEVRKENESEMKFEREKMRGN
jgi:hypothetical protein